MGKTGPKRKDYVGFVNDNGVKYVEDDEDRIDKKSGKTERRGKIKCPKCGDIWTIYFNSFNHIKSCKKCSSNAKKQLKVGETNFHGNIYNKEVGKNKHGHTLIEIECYTCNKNYITTLIHWNKSLGCFKCAHEEGFEKRRTKHTIGEINSYGEVYQKEAGMPDDKRYITLTCHICHQDYDTRLCRWEKSTGCKSCKMKENGINLTYKWSDVEIIQLKKMRKLKKSLNYIVKKLGITRSLVTKKIKELGIHHIPGYYLYKDEIDLLNNVCGIYKIVEVIDNGATYFGNSKTIGKRMKRHCGDLSGNTHKNRDLQEAWNSGIKFKWELYKEYDIKDSQQMDIDERDIICNFTGKLFNVKDTKVSFPQRLKAEDVRPKDRI